MILLRPYFMNNASWYYWDEKEWKYKLTKSAPPKAIESYNKFYSHLTNFNKMI